MVELERGCRCGVKSKSGLMRMRVNICLVLLVGGVAHQSGHKIRRCLGEQKCVG